MVGSAGLNARFVNDEGLARWDDNFPGTDEATRNNESITSLNGHCSALVFSNDAHTFENVALFFFGVGDFPFADFACPGSDEELSGRVRVLQPNTLSRIADQALIRRDEAIFDRAFSGLKEMNRHDADTRSLGIKSV